MGEKMLKMHIPEKICFSSSHFYLVTVACKDSELHLREQFTVRHFGHFSRDDRFYASRSDVSLYRKGEARLEQAEQQNDSLELHYVLQSARRHA